MKRTFTLTLLAVLLAGLAAPAGAQDKKDPKPGVAVTVYNGNYGVVREIRKLDVKDGEMKFTDVPTAIDPTTVHFESLSDGDAQLLEQNYQYDLVSAEKLLQKYIDREIAVIAEGGRYSGTLLSFSASQLVLKGEEGIVMVNRPDNVRDIRFGKLPDGLLTRPTLLWEVATKKPGQQLVKVMYQTANIDWEAAYVMVLGDGDTTADLTGWVSVNNRSGKTYTDAKLKFIAGDVQKVRQKRGVPRRMVKARPMGAEASAAMEEKAFFEYHMYTLPRPSTVRDNEVKQLEMFEPVSNVKVHKKYLYQPLGGWRWRGGTNTGRYSQESPKKVGVFILFMNSEENNLGIPLPAGKVRLYKEDPADGSMEFIGEEAIDHTPKDEKLELKVGNAFDLVGERKVTDFKVNTRAHWMKETVQIKLRNHKEEEDVTIRVKEPMYRGRNWKLLETSHDLNKADGDAHTAVWDIPVKADGEAVLTYTVEYTW